MTFTEVTFSLENDHREDEYEHRVEIQKQCNQSRGRIFDGGQIQEGLTDISQRAHADELGENPSAWKMLLAQNQDNGHKDGGDAEADEEHGEDVHPVCVDISPKDGESPKRGGGDGDEQDADEFFHFIQSCFAEMRGFDQPSHSTLVVECSACAR